ncbi:DUF948 domain-containing protein [Leptothoe sp. ISB3NOV94-8A]|uniref:hypothetical protein n=1 Tax=Adonisia turfae TaxID=2950184 RepID=UPI002029A7F5|nr:hypothetical protein [Adonisia turfae]MDV3353177.1 hypothetical protein [Leptothoe sp. LEGE 181152]
MTDPLIWLGLSILLLGFGLVALVCVSIPALIGLARAARSAEKFFDTLDRELPRTLEAMRHTGADLSDLADDMTDSVSSARNIVKQVDQSLSDVRLQASQVKRSTRSVAVGFRAAWRVLTKPANARKRKRRPPPPKPVEPPHPPSSQVQPTSPQRPPSNTSEDRFPGQ